MTSEERWLWLTTPDVQPYYLDCDNGSKSRMFQEGVITTDTFTADYAHFLTHFAFRYYEKYLGTNLTGLDLIHYQNATTLQHMALQTFQFHQDINEYIVLMIHAIDEYQEIQQ